LKPFTFFCVRSDQWNTSCFPALTALAEVTGAGYAARGGVVAVALATAVAARTVAVAVAVVVATAVAARTVAVAVAVEVGPVVAVEVAVAVGPVVAVDVAVEVGPVVAVGVLVAAAWKLEDARAGVRGATAASASAAKTTRARIAMSRDVIDASLP